MPPTPRPQGPKKKKSVPVPSSKGGSSGGASNRLYAMLGAAGLVVVAASLGYFLLGGSDAATSDAPKLLEAARQGLSASVENLESSHPKLFATVQQAAVVLGNMGL